MNATTTRPPVYCRWMVLKDFPAVLEIERMCFEFQWSEEDFRRCLAQRSVIGMVAEIPQQTRKRAAWGGSITRETPVVAGYAVYRLRETHLVLMNMAVLPAVQRRGIGSAMIRKLKAKLSTQRRTSIVTDVRDSNLDAQLFMRASEFRAVEVIRDAYEDTTEDAIVFRYRTPKGQVQA